MKKKCIVCNKTKGKRGCRLHNQALVCPKCCSHIRNPECGECAYFKEAEKYNAEKFRNSHGMSYTIELNEEVENKVDQAMQLVQRNKLGKAEKILTHLLKEHPKSHMVLYGMGALHAFKDQLDEAIVYFQKAIAIFPYFVEAHYNIAIAYKKKLDVSGMLKSLQKVIQMGAPEDECVVQARELLALSEQSIRESSGLDLDLFLKAHDRFDMGVDFMAKEEWEKAIAAFKSSLELNTSYPQTYGNLGIYYAKIGKREDAIAEFNKALEIDPNYELALVNKHFAESLEEGESLEGGIAITEYYKEYSLKGKSYIQSLIADKSDRT